MKIKRTDPQTRKKRRRQQKLIGLALVALGILSVFMTGGDATAALLIVPLGLYALFTKSDILV